MVLASKSDSSTAPEVDAVMVAPFVSMTVILCPSVCNEYPAPNEIVSGIMYRGLDPVGASRSVTATEVEWVFTRMIDTTETAAPAVYRAVVSVVFITPVAS